MPKIKSLVRPEHFINRDLSWLEFNQRVLDEAFDPGVRLLERLKFLSISSSNLDEFFEVRVAGLKEQLESETPPIGADGLTSGQTLKAIRKRVSQMVKEQYRCLRQELLPALEKHGIRFLGLDDLSPADRVWLEQYYFNQVRPVLTPLAIDPAHPFPQLLNKSLNIIIRLEMPQAGQVLRHLAVVQAPRLLPRLVPLHRQESPLDYVFLDEVIAHYLPELFPGTKLLGYWHLRVTRNSELYIDEEDTDNLLKAVEDELHNRRRGAAVRLELDQDCPLDIRSALLGTMSLGSDDLFLIKGPLNPTRFMAIYDQTESSELRDEAFVPPVASALREETDLFRVIRQGDILLHHPYESFATVVDFLEQAAIDPQVLAIKQTLYRTGGDLRIVGALMTAARQGKEVTAVVELRARFDEANNIQWARRLEEAGVHVVYGLVGYKIHAKMALVVRKEDDLLRRYLHLGTGNYNPTTARLYTDLSLLSCQADLGEDTTNLFNLLTGICRFQPMRKLLVAPFDLRQRTIELIRRETRHAESGLPALIIAKINTLVDTQVIEALYAASQAGVKIHLIVRGVCCLRPGVPQLSENITVRSIVDRFLEHSRIFYFENACQPEVFAGSADWMTRNLDRRIEVLFPIENGLLRDRVKNELLGTTWADNLKARVLHPSGKYQAASARKGEKPRRSQTEFMALARHRIGEKPEGPGEPARYRKLTVLQGPPV